MERSFCHAWCISSVEKVHYTGFMQLKLVRPARVPEECHSDIAFWQCAKQSGTISDSTDQVLI